MEKYSYKQAIEEADDMQKKIKNGNEHNYSDAEFAVEKEKIFNKYKDFYENIKQVGTLMNTVDDNNTYETTYDPDQEISWDNIVFVRSQNSLPLEKDGVLQVSTPFEESGVSRLTTHWTLNHKVKPHSYGNWEKNSCLIICPGRDMVDINGAPENLYGIDTFWAKGVKLPENAVIISSAESSENVGSMLKFLKIDPRDEPLVLDVLLEKMGYTKFRGGNHYLEWDINMDRIIRTFSKKNNILSGRHEHNWTERLENFLDDFDSSPDNFENFFKQRGFLKITDEIKNKLISKISELTASGSEYINSGL